MRSLIFFFLLYPSLAFLNSAELSSPKKESQIHENSLLHYAWSIHSQYGEEGVIEEILQRLKIASGFFVEFGAFDGVALSNTCFLISRGWKGIFIESNPESFKKCVENHKGCNQVICIKEFVNHVSTNTGLRTFDQIADSYFPGEEIDVLSIDVDSIDYLIFENLIRKPKIICIEGNLFWHPLLQDRLPDEVATATYVGQPASVLQKIGEQKGYKLVCIVGGNYLFVRNDFSHFFQDVPPDLLALWWDGYYDLGKRFPNDQKWIFELRHRNPYAFFIKKYERGRYPPLKLSE